MSETYRGNAENESDLTIRDELLDGPQPGFRRYTDEDLDEIAAQDDAYFEQLAKGLEDKRENAARDIGRNIILGQD